MAERPLRYVIIGNGIAGTTAAQTLRRNDPNCHVQLITNEPYPLYNRVALPPYLKGRVTEQKVLMRTVEWHVKSGIELLLETQVTHVQADGEKVVHTADGRVIPYDKLLVASGGRPSPLRVPGGDAANIRYFQSLDDTKGILGQLPEVRHAATYGGSYIAYELTDAFAVRGIPTTWIMRGPWFLRRVLDADGGLLVNEIARSHGVELIHDDEIANVVVRDGLVRGIETKNGRTVDCDVLCCGLGLRYNTEFLAGTGIEIKRGVLTNEFLETSLPDVYAAGDVAEFYDVMLGARNQMGTWDNATSQGKLAGLNMAGARQEYREIPTYTSTMFDSTIAVVGTTPEQHAGIESLSRVDLAARTYRRLFFLENRLVGAVMIGERRIRRHLLTLIKGGEVIANREELLFFQAGGAEPAGADETNEP